MSTFADIEETCAVCGKKEIYHEFSSIHHSGCDDLDLRPGGLYRGTMFAWIQQCPKCGYVSERVSDPSNVTVRWLRSKRYRSCNGIEFKSELAKQFYQYYLINIEDENLEDAFFALVHTAWLCDDSDDEKIAKRCRERAIIITNKLIADKSIDKDDIDNIYLIKMDLMRRCGYFDELISQFDSLHSPVRQ